MKMKCIYSLNCCIKTCDVDGIDPYCALTGEEFYHKDSINTMAQRGNECPLVELGNE